MRLIQSPKVSQILQVDSTAASTPIILSDEVFPILLDYLTKVTADYEFRTKYAQEFDIKDKRSKQLEETKKVVFSLRETDQTSDTALNFLKDRLDLLIQEREDLSLKLLAFQEKLDAVPIEILGNHIESFIHSLSFLDTDAWEEELDYYRTRFLMQREQEEKDVELKQEFLTPDQLAKYDPLSKPKDSPELKTTKSVILLSVSKKQFQQLSPVVKHYNQIADKTPKDSFELVLDTPIDTLKQQFPVMEKQSFDIGKEMYALKREQGILSLKTYEIIQTIRARVLNITGSLASRVFLKDGFKELAAIARDTALPEKQRRLKIKNEITRLLRILGKLQPGEEI
jgi:hypothetical protein